MIKKIDIYIIKKFLGTFFFILFLIILVVIFFDISEKIDEFIEHDLSISVIFNEYYVHFIPYFTNLFSPLFIFISVIYFTSKLTQNSEIIAIYNSGMSFKRLLRPFLISSVLLAIISFLLASFIIPPSNKKRLDFESKYLKNRTSLNTKNIHLQIQPGQYIYLENFNHKRNVGYNFTIENFINGKLQSKLNANYIQYDTIKNSWEINNFKSMIFENNMHKIIKGKKIDTIINLTPSDFSVNKKVVETMNFFELNEFIKAEEIKGGEEIIFHKIEKYKRIAFPFASIILTLIAVAISSKKKKGGIGTNIGIGILIAFSYILFMQISTTFSTNSNLSPEISVWIPNLIFSIAAITIIKFQNK